MTTTGSTQQALDASWSRDQVSMRSPAQQIVLTSYERSALTPEEYAAAVIAYAESAQERARRAAVQRRMDILRDAWGPLLKASLQNWVSPPVLEALLGANRDHIDLSRNPAKNIWSEQSVTYKLPPLRTTPEKPEDGRRYLELLEEAEPDFDLFLGLTELLLNACNEVLIWPDVIERNGENLIKHRYATGANVTIVATDSDPTEIECIDIIDEFTSLGGERHCQHILWTREWHATFERIDGEVKRVGYVPPAPTESGEDDPEKDTSYANPYGEIPKILIRRFPWGDSVWDQTSGEDLVDLTVKGGEERCFYRYQNKMGGFKQLLVVGQSVEKAPQQLLDQGVALHVETDGTAQVIDWQTDQKARLECIQIDELAAAASRGINPERYKRTASYQNATAAKTGERGLEETRIRSARLFRTVERKYKRLFCVVCEAHKIENPPSPEVPLKTQHAPLAYPEDPQAQLQVETGEIALGIESPVSVLQRRNPEMSDEDAREAIEKRMEEIAAVNDMKTRHNVPADPTNQSASAEQNGAQGPAVRDAKPPTGSPPVTKGDTGAGNVRSK